jgi:hypothetical protein
LGNNFALSRRAVLLIWSQKNFNHLELFFHLWCQIFLRVGRKMGWAKQTSSINPLAVNNKAGPLAAAS